VVILRRAGKHFDEIIVQSIVELVLQMPGELRMIEIARVNWKHVGVNRDGRVLQIDEDFDHAVIFARRKSEQRMIIEPQVIEYFLQKPGVGHGFIVLSCQMEGRDATSRVYALDLSSRFLVFS